MRIPHTFLTTYKVADMDTAALINVFDEAPNSLILEVGAHDEPVANMLSDLGHRVVGVDLREYNPGEDTGKGLSKDSPACNYRYVRADFCDLPADFVRDYLGRFDSVISLSALEHFGLGTYAEGPRHEFYDVIAMRTAWSLLRDGGSAYVTVPFGRQFFTNASHWRVYDDNAIKTRIVQDFVVEGEAYLAATDIDVNGQIKRAGSVVPKSEAMTYVGNPPHLSAVLKLRKRTINRIAPDGR